MAYTSKYTGENIDLNLDQISVLQLKMAQKKLNNC